MIEAITLPAGRELDALIEETVFGHRVSGDLEGLSQVPYYSTSMRHAWTVHLAMCERPFSQRKQYLNEIQLQAPAGMSIYGFQHYVAWPDVLVVLRHQLPQVICLAALRTLQSWRSPW